MSWSATSTETLKKIGGAWVNNTQIAALKVGQTGIDVHLKSGGVVVLQLERTQAVLDRAARELFSTGNENNDE